MKTSPRAPLDFPFSISSVLASCTWRRGIRHDGQDSREKSSHAKGSRQSTWMFMYESVETR